MERCPICGSPLVDVDEPIKLVNGEPVDYSRAICPECTYNQPPRPSMDDIIAMLEEETEDG